MKTVGANPSCFETPLKKRLLSMRGSFGMETKPSW